MHGSYESKFVTNTFILYIINSICLNLWYYPILTIFLFGIWIKDMIFYYAWIFLSQPENIIAFVTTSSELTYLAEKTPMCYICYWQIVSSHSKPTLQTKRPQVSYLEGCWVFKNRELFRKIAQSVVYFFLSMASALRSSPRIGTETWSCQDRSPSPWFLRMKDCTKTGLYKLFLTSSCQFLQLSCSPNKFLQNEPKNIYFG
jgi:hypothetical protein